MLINKLQQKLHSQIPLTKFMEILVENYDSKNLTTKAPLNININDKGTAFGGSLATLNIISGWSLCWLICKELGFENTNIAVIKDNHTYKKPVTKDLICKTIKPSQIKIDLLKEKLLNKGSASLKIEGFIIEDAQTCVEFNGIYVIKVID